MRKFPHFNYTPQGCAGQKGGSQTKKARSLPKGKKKQTTTPTTGKHLFSAGKSAINSYSDFPQLK